MSAKHAAFLAIFIVAGLTCPARADDISNKSKPENPRLDAFGDPLPPGAYARFGTTRLRHETEAAGFFDETTIVSVGSSIRLWDAATGKLIREHRFGKIDRTETA